LIVKVPGGSSSSFTNLSVSYNAYVDLVYPSTYVIFRHRDGLPIKISAKVIAILEARCTHGIDNNLSVATKPNKIEWRIEGKKKSSGAFKVGHSDQAEYLSRDYGESVIYHPPLELTTTPKKIEMKVNMTHAAAGDLQYGISIGLQLRRGFGKGLSSLANVTLKSANQANMRPNKNGKCGICKPELVFDKPDKPDNRIALASMVEKDDKCLMTSEYIKMILCADERRRVWLTSSAQEQILLSSLFPDQNIKWQCSAGKFVGSNTGRSVIYLTPNESGLSRSPVSIAVQEDGRTVASRRFWLLRGSSVMHC
jgi:hypothetical protein